MTPVHHSPAPRYLDDFVVGERFGSASVEITAEQIVAFAAEFDPQPFHTDALAAERTPFGGLAASGWHTAALTMRLLVGGDLRPVGGIVGAGVDELRWPLPVRPGDRLHAQSEVLEVRASRSRPSQGMLRVRTTTYNQEQRVVQTFVATLIVPRPPRETA